LQDIVNHENSVLQAEVQYVMNVNSPPLIFQLPLTFSLAQMLQILWRRRSWLHCNVAQLDLRVNCTLLLVDYRVSVELITSDGSLQIATCLSYSTYTVWRQHFDPPTLQVISCCTFTTYKTRNLWLEY